MFAQQKAKLNRSGLMKLNALYAHRGFAHSGDTRVYLNIIIFPCQNQLALEWFSSYPSLYHDKSL